MPTGYTQKTATGEVTKFEDYAKICMRAFGCAFHMRDEKIDAPYRPQEVHPYHKEELKKAEATLKRLRKLSGKEFVAIERERIQKEISCLQRLCDEAKRIRQRANEMLVKAEQWTPPTKDHAEIKEFMIRQLNITIEHDGNSNYYEKEIIRFNDLLSKVNATTARKELLDRCQRDIEYHTKEFNKEKKRVASSNKWAKQLLKSLGEKPVKA